MLRGFAQLQLAGPCRIKLAVLADESWSSSYIRVRRLTESVEDPTSDMDISVVEALGDGSTA